MKAVHAYILSLTLVVSTCLALVLSGLFHCNLSSHDSNDDLAHLQTPPVGVEWVGEESVVPFDLEGNLDIEALEIEQEEDERTSCRRHKSARLPVATLMHNTFDAGACQLCVAPAFWRDHRAFDVPDAGLVVLIQDFRL